MYMKYIVLGLIRVYQLTPGPWHKMCRHEPTCSNYATEAIIEYGLLKGMWMAFKRILKCNPWGTSGYDPVIKRCNNEKNKNT